MATLFIADVHLSDSSKAMTAGFLRFLQQQAVHAEALYILGDLFDAWIGDDNLQALQCSVAQALSTLHRQRVPCYFMHGNRDFLLGQCFAAASRLTLLPEAVVLSLYGQPTLLLHGDTLCSDDKSYQRLRYWVRQRWLQRLFLTLPLSIRQSIAARLRAESHRANQHKSMAIMDVNPQAVIQALQHYGVLRLIHGHTHRPALHTLTLDQNCSAERIVLGAWHTTGSVLQVSPQGCRLESIPL